MFITKLKNTLFYRTLINNFIYVSFSIILIAVIINNHYMFFLYIIYLIYIYKRNKIICKSIIIINIIFIIIYIIYSFAIKDYGLTEFEGIVTCIEKKDKSNKIEITNYFKKVIIYDKNYTPIEIGDKVIVTGINRKISANHNQYAFDYQKYCFSKRIVSIINAEVIETKKSVNVYIVKKYIYKYLDHFFNQSICKSYILGFIFGDTSLLSTEIEESIKVNSISHLFAISGLHVGIIISIIEKLLGKVIRNSKTRENVICVVIGIYLFVNYFQVSISRAVVMYYLKIINKRKDLKLLSLDNVSIVFIIFLFVNPFLIYNISFKLSFLASFAIIIYSESIKNTKIESINPILNNLLMTIFVQLITLPIVINMNNSFNIISPFVNVIFIALVSYIILPITFLSLFFPVVSSIYFYILETFEYVNILFKNLNISFVIPSLNIIEIVIFYIIIFLFAKYYKKTWIYVASIILVFIFMNKVSFNLLGKTSFMSLPEGDAIIIDLPLNKGVIVIDTGKRETDDVINYLKSSGIRKIDYLILTHNHDDHNGKASEIINEFKVTNIVVSEYDNSKYSKTNKTIKVKKGDKINVNGYVIDVLSPKQKSDDENDNSIVLTIKLGNLKYLFLGDATKNVEREIEISKVDVVKAGHHGSNTSSDRSFYEKVNPKYIIITSGYNNKYGFPHQEALENIGDREVHRTDLEDQIIIYFTHLFSIIT